MAIKPEDIVNKKFSFSFRGYNPDEVDAFLDEVVEEMEYLQAEIERLTSRQALVEEQQTAIGSMEARCATLARKKPPVRSVQAQDRPTPDRQAQDKPSGWSRTAHRAANTDEAAQQTHADCAGRRWPPDR